MSSELAGKTCLVTGANRGIGKATAMGLARLGAHVVLACRDAGRAEVARDEIRAASGNPQVEFMLMDLASMESIRAFAHEFKRRHPALHVLINNAGIICRSRSETIDGIERTIAVNHLAPFLLTQLLVEHMTASAPSRIITLSSSAHIRSRDLEDLQSETSYGPLEVYGRSKLANICFTYELARQLSGTGVTANCVHPGAVKTQLLLDFFQGGPLPKLLRSLTSWSFITPEKAAEQIVHLAASADFAEVSGQYFVKGIAVKSSKISLGREVASRLWARSLELTNG
jgi:NAD(P)-dependent dehydrogenase (short-subunit alcohol dehydrogenase family)